MFLLEQSTHRMVVRYHPEVGHLYVPNLRARVPHERGGYLVRTNSAGFRSDLEFQPKRGKKPRILVFGDSFTAGDGCNSEEIFAELLGRELDVEVFNFGLSGSAPDQHLLIHENFCQDMEADLILWGIAVQTIERLKLTHRPAIDRMTGKSLLVPKPYFTIEADELHLHHVPVPRARPEDTEATAPGYREGSIDKPFLERVYQDPRFRHFRAFVADHLSDLKHGLRALSYRLADVQLYDDYLDQNSQGWRLLAALVKQFHQGARGIPVLVVPLPTYHYYVDKLRPAYQPLFDQLADPDSGLRVYDLTADLIRAPLKDRLNFCFQHDSHYAPRGHREIARLIAAYIRDRSLVPNAVRAPSAIQPNRCKTVRRANFILGISCFHDRSAAALIKDGAIVAAVEEAYFTRNKSERGFPRHAINYCLEEAQIDQEDLQAIVLDRTPAAAFEPIVETLLANGDRGAWTSIAPTWIGRNLNVDEIARNHFKCDVPILQSKSHASLAAAAFHPSPFAEAAIIVVGGLGEWPTASIAIGSDHHIEILRETRFPHSLDLLAVTILRFLGFDPSSDDGFLAARALAGVPAYLEPMTEELVDVKADGSIELNMDYFPNLGEVSATNEKLAALFDGPAREAGEPLTQRDKDILKSLRAIVERVVHRTACHAHHVTGLSKLCVAGGLAFNLIDDPRRLLGAPYDGVWVQPAAGDAAGALGAALYAHHQHFDEARAPADHCSAIGRGSNWGPSFHDGEIRAFLDTHGYPYSTIDPGQRDETIAGPLRAGKTVGLFDGRLEYGCHVIGSRSVLSDRRRRGTASAAEGLPTGHAIDRSGCGELSDLMERLGARVELDRIRICPLGLAGEPGVLTPLDAYRCFMRARIDVLVMGGQVLFQAEQPQWAEAAPNRNHGGGAADASGEHLGRALQRLYDRKIAPLQENTHRHPVDQAPRAATMWQGVPADESRPAMELLSLPKGPIPDFKARASSITRSWTLPESELILTPLLEEFLALCDQYDSIVGINGVLGEKRQYAIY